MPEYEPPGLVAYRRTAPAVEDELEEAIDAQREKQRDMMQMRWVV
jgi:hypothetical protein